VITSTGQPEEQPDLKKPTALRSISIYDQVEASNYAAANGMALLLLVFCFAVLTVVYGMHRRTPKQKSWPTSLTE